MTLSLGVITGCVACGDGEIQKAEHKIWSTYSTQKVIQNATDNSIYDQLSANLSVQMMKNETEGAQLIITASSDISQYSLTACDLSDGKGNIIPVKDIQVLHQKYVEIVRMHSTNKEIKAGDFVPDMLLPMDKAIEYRENKIKKGHNQGITIEITSTHDTVPGIYTGNFILNIDGEENNIPVRCEVWDIEYEGRRSFMTSFLLYRHQLLNFEFDDSDEVVQSYIDFFMKYKVNMYVIKTGYNTEDFKAEAIRLFENNNYNSIVIPVSGVSDNIIDYIRALVEITTEEKPYIDYAYLYPSTSDEADIGSDSKKQEAYNRMVEGGEFDQVLLKAVATLEGEGAFDSMSSEFAEHVKETILNIPVVFTNVTFMENWVDNLSATFCPYLSVFDDQIAAEKYLEQAKEKADGNLWTYTCTGPLFPYPSFHTDDYSLGARVTGWMEKKLDINGFLYWSSVRSTDNREMDKYIDVYNTAARYHHCNGEGYLVYPGKYYGSASPFASLRLISHRESMDDYDMLCVYEKLLNEYAKKYSIEDRLNFNDYVNDLYDSLFTGTVYYTDDSLVFKAREELAKRILALKNEDELVVSTKKSNTTAEVCVYTNKNSIKINGETLTGTVSGDGYVYKKSISTSNAQTITIETTNNTYTYNLNATAKITDFATNGAEGIVCSGREGIENTQSKISINGDKASVMIRSYYAKGNGWGAEIDREGIDGATQRLMPSVTFPVRDFGSADNIYFSVKNIGETDLEMYLYLVMDSGLTEEIGTAYCGVGKSNDIRIHIDETHGIDLSNVTSFRIAFKNIEIDALGFPSLWADREFELSDIWFEKK